MTSVLSYVGNKATVFVDKDKPKKYRVVISGLKDEDYAPDNVPKAVGVMFMLVGAFGTFICGSILIKSIINGDYLWWGPAPIGGFFFLFLLLGLIIFLKTGNPQTERELLVYTGEKLRGEIIQCKENKGRLVN